MNVYREVLQTRVDESGNEYIWPAATERFDCFTYIFTWTDAGWVWAYAYGFTPELDTFIVECSAESWNGLGFATNSEAESLAFLESLIITHLKSHRLVGKFTDRTNARWQRYRTVTNKNSRQNGVWE